MTSEHALPPTVDDLGSGPTTIGTFIKSNSAVIAEVIALTEIEFLVIDRQHASPTLGDIEDIVRAAAIHDLPVFARLPSSDCSIVGNLLDSGITGLIVPGVERKSDVTRIVDASRYAKDRSFALSTRAGVYGHTGITEHTEHWDNAIEIIPMIESKEGAENTATIAGMDAVNTIMVGPADLGLSLGIPLGDPDHVKAIEDIFDAASSVDCGTGIYAGSPTEIDNYTDDAAFIIYSSDIAAIDTHYNLDISE